MNRLQIYKTLYSHRKLAAAREADGEQNRKAKVMVYLGYAFMLLYLSFLSVPFSLAVNASPNVNAAGMLTAVLPMLVVVDFLMRFVKQQTPAQVVKPYLLLPLPRIACIETFVGMSLLNWGNLAWFFLFVPYCIMSVVFSYGIFPTLLLLLFLWIVVLIGSQCYLIVRTLINASLLWWLLPLTTVALLALPAYIGRRTGIQPLLDFYSHPGIALSFGNPLPIAAALVVLSALVIVNRRVQFRAAWTEISGTEPAVNVADETRAPLAESDAGRKTVFGRLAASFAERLNIFGRLRAVLSETLRRRLGETAEYLRLEIKLIGRNRTPRKTFLYSTATTALFSLLVAFTAMYDEELFTVFWCSYCFMLYGVSSLSRLMCSEGNYIEALMVRPGSIYALLRAKYIFYSAMLVVPFVLMLPAVFTGKWTLLMLVSFALFTAGLQYFIFFQFAVYNRQTQPLNTRLTSLRSVDTNYVQVLISIVSLLMPTALLSLFVKLFGDTTAQLIIAVLGLLFVLTSPIWLRNVSNRFMLNRHNNMDGFRQSR